ncbi:MAG: DAK2 domain-containing protein, partial [Eubacteriales bacterium]
LACGEIKAVGDDSFSVLQELLGQVVNDDSDIISIYYGGNVTADKKEQIEDVLEEKYEDCDVLVYEGGQPLYDFIFSVE